MAIVDVLVSQLGESIVEGVVVGILKKNGDSVAVDEVILELETDKITVEILAAEAGVIQNMNCNEGDVLQVGQKIAEINTEGSASATSDKATKESIPESKTTTLEKKSTEDIEFGPKNSPAAEKIIAENDLKNVAGTGKDGRITKEDALKAMVGSPKTTTPTKTQEVAVKHTETTDLQRQERVVKMSPLRKKIAQRLKDSQNTAAILTTFNEVDMGAVMALRKKYKEIFEKKHGVKLGFMSFFVKAATYALQEIPEVNAEIRDGAVVYKNYCDIGVAVGSDKGLVVPVLRDTQKMQLHDIELNILKFGKKAKEGTLAVSDMTGGTFTISNGGVYGSLMSTPIINPPQSAILGMHSIVQRPVVRDQQITIAPMMYVALSYDHRLIDGKEAVTFLVKIKNYIEDPNRLLMGI